MIFTINYTAYPERQTTFTKTVQRCGRIHALIPKASPWCHGMIERTHPTDNEQLWARIRFTSCEERRYWLQLWQQFYNHQRHHQGLAGQTPMEVYKKEYMTHAATRMLI